MPYQLSRDGQLFGPYTLEDLQRYLATNNVLPGDLVKSESDPEWVTVAQLLDIGAAPLAGFSSPPAWESEPIANAIPAQPTRATCPFFPVSVPKFIVMSLCTLGLYHVYWAYKSWVRIRDESGEDLMPWARAFFIGIFNFSLFDRIQSHAAQAEVPTGWNPVVLGAGVLIFGAISRLPHGWGMLSLLSFIPYIPIVATIAKINEKLVPVTTESPNRRLTAVNIVWVVIGGIIVVLAIVGSVGEASGVLPSN